MNGKRVKEYELGLGAAEERVKRVSKGSKERVRKFENNSRVFDAKSNSLRSATSNSTRLLMI